MERPGTSLPSDIKSDYILIIMIKERKEVTRTTHPYGSNPSPCFSSMYIDREREARSVSHFLSHFFLSAARARQASRKQSRAGTGSTPPQNPLLARSPLSKSNWHELPDPSYMACNSTSSSTKSTSLVVHLPQNQSMQAAAPLYPASMQPRALPFQAWKGDPVVDDMA
jgi:hypothetical protein